MGMRMLIDATHLEETRVVVVKGTRLEEFDYETSTKQVLKGNIYLARVTRVEPSLQAAFVEYGGNRHGFLAFGEIHPDYYQIPIADRRALLEQQAEEEARAAQAEDEEFEAEDQRRQRRRSRRGRSRPQGGEGNGENRGDEALADGQHADDADHHDDHLHDDDLGDDNGIDTIETVDGDYDAVEEITPARPALHDDLTDEPAAPVNVPSYWNVPARNESVVAEVSAPVVEPEAAPHVVAEPAPAVEAAPIVDAPVAEAAPVADAIAAVETAAVETATVETAANEVPAVEGVAPVAEMAAHAEHGDEVRNSEGADVSGVVENGKSEPRDEHEERRPRRTHFSRRYKIQEVIKRRQIMLVQVVKEERGNKGAALTTYLSLAGRYCVLMPNTARGGGISRKISSPADRKRLKSITSELDIPQGMGVIVRTAGMERSKPEIKRDFEYLLRSWDSIRERTLESSAPTLIYEEADLIKRSIRDLYSNDIDEVLVEGVQGHEAAHDFMQMLMPSHADRVKLYQDKIPLFHRYQVEQQLDSMFTPTVQLRSGGYIVINPTEALVSIDINSGKSTREHNIEETAYKTNLEAAEEIARQLRLRDLAGLVVIDFIDMEDNRNIRKVEQRLKECLRGDRARIQVGRISGFGLLEMSRQRLRPSLIESSTMPCPHCQGRGYVRSTESTALQVLRAIEEEGIRDRAGEIIVAVPAEVAIYLLNHKRERLSDIERRYVMRVIVAADNSLVPPDYKLDRAKLRQPGEVTRPELSTRVEPQRPITQESSYADAAEELAFMDQDGEEDGFEADTLGLDDAADEAGQGENGQAENGTENGADSDGRRRRRRRRRRGGRGDEANGDEAGMAEGSNAEAGQGEAEFGDAGSEANAEDTAEGEEAEGEEPAGEEAQAGESQADGEQRRRRRGRRGGRRRRRDEGGAEEGAEPRPAQNPDRPQRMPRENNQRDMDQGDFLTPAAIGAMLDGGPMLDLDLDEPRPAPKPVVVQPAPQPAPVSAPEPMAVVAEASAPVAVPEATMPEVAPAAAPEAAPVEPVAAIPATPVHTGPIFETVVVTPDGSQDKPAEPPPTKRGWWSR
ncbi:Rne/Rng family ribonuclease [Ferrovibrio sp.]|uniref:Rne/Rng family ribonuclease n=1 Tax=Ferrovibrio sp. TaxID=1917215 RepID=UPI0025C4F899|nr:Rne/Rng family ribonuclease [Ferrovibrio sp.]